MPKKVYWPSWRYHPTECPDGKLFTRPEDVPAGWVSHLKDFVETRKPGPGPATAAPQAVTQPAPKPPTAKEIKAAEKAAAIAAEAAEKERLDLLAKAREKFGAVPDDATIEQLKAALNTPAA